MSIFEFAMQMELDGEKFYRELAEKSGHKGLKKIFTHLADEEVGHYNIFKDINERIDFEIEETTILEDSKNIFIEMKNSGSIDVQADIEQKDAYQIALDMEKKAYTFFEEKAKEANGPGEMKLLQAIAKEERRHYRLIEGIIDFISRPETWIENAEFNNLSNY